MTHWSPVDARSGGPQCILEPNRARDVSSLAPTQTRRKPPVNTRLTRSHYPPQARNTTVFTSTRTRTHAHTLTHKVSPTRALPHTPRMRCRDVPNYRPPRSAFDRLRRNVSCRRCSCVRSNQKSDAGFTFDSNAMP